MFRQIPRQKPISGGFPHCHNHPLTLPQPLLIHQRAPSPFNAQHSRTARSIFAWHAARAHFTPHKLATQSFAPSYRCAGYHFVNWRNMLDFKSPTSYISSHNEMKRTSTSTIPTEYLCSATFPLFGRLATKTACEYSWPCACGPCVFAR